MKYNYENKVIHTVDREIYKAVEVIANSNKLGQMMIVFVRIEYRDEITTIKIKHSRVVKEEFGIITYECKADLEYREIRFRLLYEIESHTFFIRNDLVK